MPTFANVVRLPPPRLQPANPWLDPDLHDIKA